MHLCAVNRRRVSPSRSASLSLEQAYRGIAFHLAHREEADAYLRVARSAYPQLYAKWIRRVTHHAKVPNFKMSPS